MLPLKKAHVIQSPTIALEHARKLKITPIIALFKLLLPQFAYL